MKITFLEAELPLTKSFTLENGEIKKHSYPNVLNYTSHEEDVQDIEAFYRTLVLHASLGHCLLKGNLSRQLVVQPRRGTTDANAPTRWTCLDLDGIKSEKNIKDFLKKLGLDTCDYIVQFSSSSGVLPDRGLSAHIFILLSDSHLPAFLKQWLTSLNLTFLQGEIALTRTNNALRWPLDITTCQNDKLIYISPPILGDGIRDHFKGERIQLIRRRLRHLSITGAVPSAESNKRTAEVLLGELRKKANLLERKSITFRTQGEVEYMAKPDESTITGMKEDRGFVYFNLNGGDSWGYYHAKGQAEFIHNFKGEPTYKTSELLPDYWKSCRKEVYAERRSGTEGNLYLAFRDFKSAAYWNGSYDRDQNILDLAQARSTQQLDHYLRSHGQTVPEYYEDWRISFDPTTNTLVDVKKKTVNSYEPSDFARKPWTQEDKIPPLVRRVIFHALGNDEECFDHFINWLAVIIQKKCKTGTSWILSGNQGTGKGATLDQILKPILGDKQVCYRAAKDLESQFNGYLEQCLIMYVDEVKVSAFKNKDGVNSTLKGLIVEPKLSIRKMHTNYYEAKSYLNIILVGNEGEEAQISPSDRRFNVGVFQPNRLEISEPEYQKGLPAEQQQFYNYLMSYPADTVRARKALNNEAKRLMMHRSMTAIDVAAKALLEGDYQFFADQKRAVSLVKLQFSNDEQAAAYNALVDKMKDMPNLLREEVQLLLNYTIGGIPESPHKFTTYCKYHKILFNAVYRDGKTFKGIKVKWNDNSALPTSTKTDATNTVNGTEESK